MTRWVRRLMVWHGAALAALVGAASAVSACPTCKDAVSGDPVAAALSWTTLVLIAVPLSLIGSIGGWLFFAYRRVDRAAAPLWSMLTGKESES